MVYNAWNMCSKYTPCTQSLIYSTTCFTSYASPPSPLIRSYAFKFSSLPENSPNCGIQKKAILFLHVSKLQNASTGKCHMVFVGFTDKSVNGISWSVSHYPFLNLSRYIPNHYPDAIIDYMGNGFFFLKNISTYEGKPPNIVELLLLFICLYAASMIAQIIWRVKLDFNILYRLDSCSTTFLFNQTG